MVIDASKGIEPQTRKLFEVCRQRRSADPDLRQQARSAGPRSARSARRDRARARRRRRADELADRRRRPSSAASTTCGVSECLLLSSARARRGERRAAATVAASQAIPRSSRCSGDDAARDLLEAVRAAREAGTAFDRDAYRAARQTPVFFGSALTNFGLEPFLHGAGRAGASAARPRPSDRGMIDPLSPDFTGFVFKIQANMDPRHRDRVAFVRVCSGVLAKDMLVTNARLDSPLRLSRPHRFFGRDRETVDDAYPGDVVGLVNPGPLRRSATRSTPARRRASRRIPRFAAEHFGTLCSKTRAPSSSTTACAARRRRPDAGAVSEGKPARADARGRRRAAVRDRRRADARRIWRQVPRRSAELLRRRVEWSPSTEPRPARSRRRPAATSPRSIARIASCCCSPRTGSWSTASARIRTRGSSS